MLVAFVFAEMRKRGEEGQAYPLLSSVNDGGWRFRTMEREEEEKVEAGLKMDSQFLII
jgi:hypothetical protein